MELHIALITIGCLFFIGLITDELGRKTRLPRVTLLIVFGILSGPVGFDVLPSIVRDWYEFLSSTALTMVAFLLGSSLTKAQLKEHGKKIVVISLAVVASSVLIVGGGLILLGMSPVLALLLAGIATATDPAATRDIIRQQDYKGEFVDTVKGIVAIDDLWGLMVFSLLLVVANTFVGETAAEVLQQGFWEVVGGIVVGTAIGFPAAVLTGRLRPGDPIQSEALAIVFLCAGISLWLEVSFLLSGVIAGAIVVNFAKHHTHTFREIEHFEWPFMILFFFLAGASLNPGLWQEFIFGIVAFILLRIASRFLGGWVGSHLCKAPPGYGTWMGMTLMPQAGVAIGMALIAGNHFPGLREELLTIALATTVVFEIYGPFASRFALEKMDQRTEGKP